MSFIEGYGVYQNQKNYYDTTTGSGRKTRESGSTSRAEKADAFGKKQVKLSERAQKLLEELQKTYGNMDFIVADYDSEEEAQYYLSRGTKEYSVLIDPETLEEMAADSETKEKYLSILTGATQDLDSIKDQLKEEGTNVKSIGITIGKDGTVSYFAELERMGERQRERIEQSREDRRAEEKEAEERASKREEAARREQPHIPHTTQRVSIKADTAEDLLAQIQAVDWSKVKPEEQRRMGGRFDFSI